MITPILKNFNMRGYFSGIYGPANIYNKYERLKIAVLYTDLIPLNVTTTGFIVGYRNLDGTPEDDYTSIEKIVKVFNVDYVFAELFDLPTREFYLAIAFNSQQKLLFSPSMDFFNQSMEII